MRTLGIETSGGSGSVALVEDGQLVLELSHQELNQHAERVLGLVEQALAEAGWQKQTLNRIAVSRGPGSFTALRIGLALGQGLALGLGIEAVGVCSLQALAASALRSDSGWSTLAAGTRIAAIRDARRDEFFLACSDENGLILHPPEALSRALAEERIRSWFEPTGVPHRVVGSAFAVGALAGDFPWLERDDPQAACVALLGETMDPERNPAVPEYVRGPNVVKPPMRPSPLRNETA